MRMREIKLVNSSSSRSWHSRLSLIAVGRSQIAVSRGTSTLLPQHLLQSTSASSTSTGTFHLPHHLLLLLFLLCISIFICLLSAVAPAPVAAACCSCALSPSLWHPIGQSSPTVIFVFLHMTDFAQQLIDSCLHLCVHSRVDS